MSDFLDQMAASSRERARLVPANVRRLAGAFMPRMLVPRGFSVIAEVKLSAPSVGVLAAPADPVRAAAERAATYASAGAAAISVLTEPSRFAGDLSHLQAAAQAADAPVMRKDFLVDPAQVWEARAHGASGVLLIATMLDDDALSACLEAADEAGLFVLLEGFDAADLERMAAFHARWTAEQPLWLGLNCRDLRTLQVDPQRFDGLASAFPAGAVAVAESGIETAEDARRVQAMGYAAVLVGSALMRADDPASLLRSLSSA